MRFKRLILLVSIIALPTTALATEQGIRRHYGGDWLAKHRAATDRPNAGKATEEGVAPSTPAKPTP